MLGHNRVTNEKVGLTLVSDTTVPLAQVRPAVNEHGYPLVVAIGSSHVTHWAGYRQRQRYGSEEHDIFRGFTFAGVGWLKLKNAIPLLGRIGLLRKKKYFGDQWAKLIKRPQRPHYRVRAARSNDCDDVDRYLKADALRSCTDLKHKRKHLSCAC